jgi:predicted DNA binding CopG/RHH family protein
MLYFKQYNTLTPEKALGSPDIVKMLLTEKWGKSNDVPIEKSHKGNLKIRLSPDLHKKAAYNASKRGISLNQYINEAIKKEIASSDPE